VGITIIKSENRELEEIVSRNVETPDGSGRTQRRIIADDAPYAHIVEIPPGAHIPGHSHSEREITVVLSGSAMVNGVECSSGTVVVVDPDENYAVTAGSEPFVFLVVRPKTSRIAQERQPIENNLSDPTPA
jgi:quercetin dioxygenase-like cupin family protein